MTAFMPAFALHKAMPRVARSLMARAGVAPHVAERTLGHAVTSIIATYDQHGYDAEKADALERLAKLVEQIVRGEGCSNDEREMHEACLRMIFDLVDMGHRPTPHLWP